MSQPRSSLERAVLATLAYFDVFDYPLRVEELWRWLYIPDDVDPAGMATTTPSDIEHAVQSLESSGVIERIGEFVVVAGRSMIVVTRSERLATSQRMWRRARFASSILRLIPFVRFVGVVNTLAIDNVRPESDIDLFIVVRRGRLWLTRMSVTILTYVLGIRRHGRKVAGRVCLSFFLTDRNLSLESMKFEAEDPYLVFWLASIVPMFDRSGTWFQLLDANQWIDSRLPNGRSIRPLAYHADAWLPGMLRSSGEWCLETWIGDASEHLAKTVQTFKMKFPSLAESDRGESGVVVSNDILKFHERDRRREYRQAFYARQAEIQ